MDLASQVEEENAIGGGQHIHIRQGAQAVEHAPGLGLAQGVEGDVADHLVAPGFHDVDGAEARPLLGQDRGDAGKLPGPVGDLHTHGHAIVAVRFSLGHHVSLPSVGWVFHTRMSEPKVLLPVYRVSGQEQTLACTHWRSHERISSQPVSRTLAHGLAGCSRSQSSTRAPIASLTSGPESRMRKAGRSSRCLAFFV